MLFYRTGQINSYHPLDSKLRCFFCKHTNNKIDINDLISRFFQKYPKIPSCELTGKRINLSLGNTYELDHIIPVSKGGESTFENMQIVLSSVNRMKSHYDLDEFITICNLVAKKHPID
jgi:CRISPR/Cas system Type II protein with McrA/HNH and RuvC-like nuclease domain